ncbi:MAG TPA: DUF1622 domain-containing protein [Pyrinomonadaceae bacterium]
MRLKALIAQEGTNGLINGPSAGAAENTVSNAVQWLRLVVETTGAIIIGMGVLTAMYQFARALVPPQVESYNSIRLTLARYLALALEFQLGADILSTAIAPSWDRIGKLGAIAVIRTALNFFLTREMSAEKKGAAADEGGAPEDGGKKE